MILSEILENFELLDDWEDRYRYVIELGRELEPLPEEARSGENKVQGCVSQVWLETRVEKDIESAELILKFRGDSDAHIVRGLVAIVFAIFSGRPAQKILDIDALSVFNQIGLNDHLTPQRSNGLASMVARIRTEAESALSARSP